MALVRVNTDGRGTLLKMNRKDADAYVASHSVASVQGDTPPELEAEVAASTDDAFDRDLDGLKKDELVALAEAQGVDASGTKADIIERLDAAGG